MTNTIRLGVIGAGAIADVAHFPVLATREDVEVRWLADANESRARAKASHVGAREWTADHQRVLDDPEVDAVAILTGPRQHAPLAIQALESGKHVLLEKPMARDAAEALEIKHVAEATGKCFMVAENWYFAFAVRRAKEFLHSEAIGTPHMIRMVHESPFRIPPIIGDPSEPWILSVGTHVFSATRFLLDEFASVSAMVQPRGADGRSTPDVDAVINAELASGVLGSFAFTSRSRHLGERRLGFAIYGDDGLLEFDVWSGRIRLTRFDTETNVEHRMADRGYGGEWDHFLHCLRTGETPLPNADDQLKTMQVVDACYRSAASRRMELIPSSRVSNA
jgi:predicted dehydrogenase